MHSHALRHKAGLCSQLWGCMQREPHPEVQRNRVDMPIRCSVRRISRCMHAQQTQTQEHAARAPQPSICMHAQQTPPQSHAARTSQPSVCMHAEVYACPAPYTPRIQAPLLHLRLNHRAWRDIFSVSSCEAAATAAAAAEQMQRKHTNTADELQEPNR